MAFNYSQPYIVVGAFIVRDEKILLIQENHPPDKGKWNLPAGKLDFGEDPIEAAKREAFEEAGINFKPTALLGLHSVYRKDKPEEVHVLRIVFMGEGENEVSLEHSEPVDGIAEIADHKWVTPDEILAMDDREVRYHDLKHLTEMYVAHQTYPLEAITHFTQIKK